MSVNRETHRTFLTDNGASEELANRTMKYMERLFVNAENGTYPLMSKEALEAEGYGPRFAEVIEKATGQEVENIIFLSLEHPLPKLEWMSEEDYRNSLWNSLGNSLGNSLHDSFRDSLGNRLRSSLWDSLWSSLRNSLHNTLWMSLRSSLWDNLWDNLRDSPGDSLWSSLWDSLERSLRSSLYLPNRFALVGDKEEFERVAPLLELQASGLALSNLKHAPRTWLVLCK